MPQKAITQLVCFLSTLTLLITGCGTGSIEELPATEIIGRSTERMTSLQGFEFLIQRTGGLAFVDYTQTIAFSRAEGRFNSPDGVAASIRVIGPGLVAEVRIISLGHQQWETNLLSGQWQASDPRYSFNPAALFSPNTGIAWVLANSLDDIKLRGIEELAELPGQRLYVLEALMAGEHASILTFGMIDPEELKVSIWVDPVTFDIERITLVDPANQEADEDTIWQIDFWNFNTRFEIAAPSVDQGKTP